MRERLKKWWQKPTMKWGLGAIASLSMIGLVSWLLWWLWVLPDRRLQPDYRSLTNNERATLAHQYRGMLIGGIGTIATIVGGVFLFLNFRLANQRLNLDTKKITQDAELAEDRLISERFAKAIEQLGNENSIHIWLGGIYSLGRLAENSDEKMRKTVLDVLSAFVRERHPNTSTEESKDTLDKTNQTPVQELETDVCTALMVIWDSKKETDSFDLRKTSFRDKNLSGAKLDGSRLSGADFRNANLRQVKIRKSDLIDVDFRNADLREAKLSKSDLRKAKFHSAKLHSADFRSADLRQAKLIGTKLCPAPNCHTGANLSKSNLTYADLTGADLTGANLSGANLSGAILIGDAQLFGAWLIEADLTDAQLSGADLSVANLNGCILMAVDLRNIKGLTLKQLTTEKPPLLCNVALPQHITDADIDPNRDCDRLPQILSDRYNIPLEDAQRQVEAAKRKQWD
jgi:uncharacterized protein YjbI with pentapeptide repeats